MDLIANLSAGAGCFFGAKPGSLAKIDAGIAADDRDVDRALRKLTKEADEVLEKTPVSVVEKRRLAPTGDPHDYMSLAPFFWPNPGTKDGLPYLRRDGKVNPESLDESGNDGPRVKAMGDSIETLALAYYFTNDERYAAHAARFARAWFLDPATCMNPNLTYAQAVTGLIEGRGNGIIEGRSIATAAAALGLLQNSKAWPPEEQEALAAWLGTYLDWLLHSEAGRAEHEAKNNHGSFYSVQAVRIALAIGRLGIARELLEEAKDLRIAAQIAPDGRQPHELVRTASFSYFRLNLHALCELATLGEHADVDLWRFATNDGRSIRRAIDYLLPYVDLPGKPWPGQQIKEKREDQFLPVLRQSALAFGDARYEAILTRYGDQRSKRFQLLFAK